MTERGFANEPDPGDPAQMHTKRVIEAVNAAYKDEAYQPRIVVVLEYPASGDPKAPDSDARIAIASTGNDALDTHRMLALGIGAIKAASRLAAEKN